MQRFGLSLFLLLFLAACQPGEDGVDRGADDRVDAVDAGQPAAASPADDARADATMTAEELVDTEFSPNLAQYIQTLAADEFAGRQPASEGEEKTVSFLRERFQAAGLRPSMGDSFYQQVPLVEITVTQPQPVVFHRGQQRVELPFGEAAVTWTKRVTESVAVADSDVVFAGYGIVAPEYGWNDYADIDVRGKTVLVLVNDPGFATGDEALFRGRTMTYYGRWTYKFEEAARQGAAMVLIVHEPEAAGYGFDVVQGSWTGPQFDLVSADMNRGRAAIEGWLEHSAAQRVFQAAGEDLDSLSERAAQPGFRALPLDLKAGSRLANNLRQSTSRNVVAVLPGSEQPDEYFIYTAHWDHLGTNPALDGDTIYNGAQDNATGTAALLVLAEQFAQAPRPRRSIAFVAVTAEESGLLGSRYFANNPPFPMAQIVAGINMDALNIHGPMRDLVVVGYGNSELEPLAQRLAAAQNRRVEPNPYPEKGFYYRSDHFNLAKHGVPMLYAKGGIDHFEKGEKYGRQRNLEYISERYHKPADEYGEWWDLRGMNQDLALFYRMGRELADSDRWPNWYEGIEFRAVRDASRAAAAQDGEPNGQ